MRVLGKNATGRARARLGACLVGALLVVNTVAGCNRTPAREPSKEIPVTGKVTFDGSPLAEAQVDFVTAGSVTFSGATDSAGVYKLWSPVGATQACEGPCKVTVSKYVLPPGATPQPGVSPVLQGGKQLLGPTYSDINLTTLKADVSAAGGTFDFPLQSK